MLKGPIAKATIRTSFVLGLRLVVQAGTLLLVARMLGPEQFGAFAGIAALAVLMGTFSTFGTHLVLLGEVSKDKTKRTEVLVYAVPTTLISGSFLFLAYLAISLSLFSELQLPLSALICIGLTETILLPLFTLPATEQLALEKTARSQLLMVLPLALRMLAALGVLLLAPLQPLTVFAWLYLTTALLALFAMKIYSTDAWLNIREWRLASKVQLKHSAGYATLALTAAGPSELDKMLAVKLLPLGVSGLYAAASRVIGAAITPVIALLLSAQPKLFRSSAQNPVENRRIVKWVFAAVFCYGIIFSGVIWFFSPAVEWVLGEQYAGITEMIRWLCLLVPLVGMRLAAGSVLMTMDKPWQRAGMEFSGVLVLLVSAIPFVEHAGWLGLPLALFASELVMVIFFFVLFLLPACKRS